jgi:hypothetical protein
LEKRTTTRSKGGKTRATMRKKTVKPAVAKRTRRSKGVYPNEQSFDERKSTPSPKFVLFLLNADRFSHARVINPVKSHARQLICPAISPPLHQTAT